ncbi:MAG: YkgJ family cysteine cluster protein [Desulfobacteraceae bacterium]|nr:MAG: YkgJ family cysteine cluster protein [Desulfobacteraceae bacterium]
MPFKSVQPEDLFECQKCGDCCKGFGGTYVTQADIENIAQFIGTRPDTFVRDFCQLSGGLPVLAQKKDQFCVFWDDEKLCTIHPVKPRMCKAWPFIESVMIDPANWEIMSGACPGIRTDYPLKVVQKCIKKILSDNRQAKE